MTDTAIDRSLNTPPEHDRLTPSGHLMAATHAQTAARYAEKARDGLITAAARTIRRHGAENTGRLPDEAREQVAGFLSRADRNDDRALRYRAAAEQHLKLAVKAEPRTYSPDAPASFWRDTALAALPSHPERSVAVERLERHRREVDVEIKAGSPEGRAALAQFATEARHRGIPVGEVRAAMTTGSSSGGSFVTPAWLQDLWAVYRSQLRSFTNQCTHVDAPDYGMQVNIPSFTSATSVAQMTQNSGVPMATPSGIVITATMVSMAGEVTVSQQLFDRGGPVGFDRFITEQLKEQLDAAVNSYVLTQALANAGMVTDATSLTIPKFYTDLSSAREKLTDTAGVRLAATHVFSTSDFAGWVTRQVDSQNRPIVTPSAAAIAAFSDDPLQAGFLGLTLPGNLRWFADDMIPLSSTHTQVIVAKPSTIAVVESEPLPFAYEETFATTLSVVVGVRSYVAAAVRYPKAIAAISGAGYPTTLV